MSVETAAPQPDVSAQAGLSPRSLPADGRSAAQVTNHYLVEKELAQKLRNTSSRAERTSFYRSMYDELFRRVPDHPRLLIRDNEARSRRHVAISLAIVEPFLTPDAVVAEFAPGDCKLSREIARSVKRVYGIDISDQREANHDGPDNFSLVVYDGYETAEIATGSVDVAFSDQLIEHLHPQDTEDHFRFVNRLLKRGGAYVLRTPHCSSGPHDVSQYFSDVPQGFHLKEWTFAELFALLRRLDYSSVRTYWYARGFSLRLPKLYFLAAEKLAPMFGRKLAHLLIPSICVAIVK